MNFYHQGNPFKNLGRDLAIGAVALLIVGAIIGQLVMWMVR